MTKRIGLIVNPVAGIGGSVALKGSDGPEIQKLAFERGAVRKSGIRTRQAFERLTGSDIEFLCGPGLMGEDVLLSLGIGCTVVGESRQKGTDVSTGPEDTERIASEMAKAGVDLIVFAGGDGTARNVYNAIGDTIPVLGIPAGVKIHSAVFALSPARAGILIDTFSRTENPRLRQAEVIDLNEEKYRAGQIGDTLYGYMKVPDVARGMQNPKAASHNSDRDVEGIIAELEEELRAHSDICYFIGAGSTTHALKEKIEPGSTLLGVDIYRNGKRIASDLGAAELLEIASHNACRLILTPIGGMGHVFGRGNQQFSPDVIRAVGPENIIIIAAAGKIFSLPGQTLITDTGDSELDEELRGYRRVIVGWQEYIVCKID